jgi:hypothetical protein
MAVLDLGTTGCTIVCFSSSPSMDREELERNLLATVFWVSALWRGLANREDMLPRCFTDTYSMLDGLVYNI